ncbi:hypothetical protein SAMN05444487_103237 [Marininema mesophilum]|uniref:Uncharacterized protein n=1 Tax=Marininema mesophilum TaxID=1048340 RepID=A0A1H2TS77_9BACL|nr:hypothetical protein [Marininema mesophilum]SDW46750.1 hypothetical protein SAMN05444487_103237 [Marininema mesophilum]
MVERQVYLELNIGEDHLANGLSQAVQEIRDSYDADSVVVQQVIPHDDKNFTVIVMAYGAKENTGK